MGDALQSKVACWKILNEKRQCQLEMMINGYTRGDHSINGVISVT